VSTSGHQTSFSMSAFYGVLAIRKYSNAHTSTPLSEVLSALRRLSPDEAYHDYETAIRLNDLLISETDHTDIPTFFRHLLSAAINDAYPWWVRLIPFGRDRLRAALTDNEKQCFEAADLFSAAPPADILRWWDTLAQRIRADEDDRKLLQGREAEQLTIAYEIRRLSHLGIDLAPRWIALDDNSAGYDVHSFDPGPVAPIAKLIEVKSCTRENREIFLTQTEWETAIERAPNYRFHIWKLPERELIELTPAELSGHVPYNNGKGVWQIVRITLS
jgi:hypothetical protein